MGSGMTSTCFLMGYTMLCARLTLLNWSDCNVWCYLFATHARPYRCHLKFNCLWWWQLQWSSGRHCQGHCFLPASVRRLGWGGDSAHYSRAANSGGWLLLRGMAPSACQTSRVWTPPVIINSRPWQLLTANGPLGLTQQSAWPALAAAAAADWGG